MRIGDESWSVTAYSRFGSVGCAVRPDSVPHVGPSPGSISAIELSGLLPPVAPGNRLRKNRESVCHMSSPYESPRRHADTCRRAVRKEKPATGGTRASRDKVQTYRSSYTLILPGPAVMIKPPFACWSKLPDATPLRADKLKVERVKADERRRSEASFPSAYRTIIDVGERVQRRELNLTPCLKNTSQVAVLDL